MVESVFPKCPNCKEEVLIPLSACIDIGTVKVFAHWICVKCGFYVGTGDTKAYNIPEDIYVEIIPEIPEKFKKAKQQSEK